MMMMQTPACSWAVPHCQHSTVQYSAVLPAASRAVLRCKNAPRKFHAKAPLSLKCQAVQGVSSSTAELSTPRASTPQAKPTLVTEVLLEPSKVKRRGLMMAGAAAMFGCACCMDMLPEAKAAEWKYSGVLAGPNTWGGVCAAGANQSPINVVLPPKITITNKFPTAPMDFGYGRAEKVDVLNTGHGTMQVNFNVGNKVYVPPRIIPSNEISAYGEPIPDRTEGEDCLCPSTPFNLELLQYHFHSPSEHTLDGQQFVMEVHLVHRNKDTGGLAVIAVMMEPGGDVPNAALQLGLDFVPEEAGKPITAPKAIDPSILLPARNPTYVHYQGSLTTPPCSESVDWFVMTVPVKITDKQALDFLFNVGNKATYAYNNRPIQPMNGRQLEYYEYNI